MLAELHLHYDPLPVEGPYTRLLHLRPGQHGDTISCTLSLANLDMPEEPYIAVSYTWGSGDVMQEILVNGSTFPVRKNLYELLHAFRQSDRAVTLWIDAICIDQSSMKERNHQVGKMGEIFSKAERVNAWLGSTNEEIDEAFTDIQEIVRFYRGNIWPIPQDAIDRAERSMSLFQGSRYWSRAWIIQELVLAQDILFFWGANSLSCRDLLTAVSMAEKERAPTIREIIVMRDLFQGRRPFEELFTRFVKQECALDHDKFYSLYSMVKDEFDLDGDFPLPDYGLCIVEVFMQQLLRWKNRVPLQSPMSFVHTFITHFPQATWHRSPCVCHSKSFVSIRLPFRGTIRAEQAGDSFCIQRENDIYRFRRFSSEGGSVLRYGDLAFELEPPLWNLVVRQHKDSHREDAPTQRTIDVIGLGYRYDVASGSFGLVKHLSGFATEKIFQLSDQESVLTVQMRVGLLIELARFITNPYSEHH